MPSRGGSADRGRGGARGARGGGSRGGKGSFLDGGDGERARSGDRNGGKPFSPSRGSDRGGRSGGGGRGGGGGNYAEKRPENGGKFGDRKGKTFSPGRGRGGGSVHAARGGRSGSGSFAGSAGKRDENGGGNRPAIFAKGDAAFKKLESKKSLDLPMGGDGRWFEHIPDVSELSEEKDKKRKRNADAPQALVDELKEQARLRLEQEVWTYDSKGKGRVRDGPGQNNTEFLKKILGSGTLTDKMASMTLMVQEAPMMRLNVLDMLLKMAARRGKREHAMALDTLKVLRYFLL